MKVVERATSIQYAAKMKQIFLAKCKEFDVNLSKEDQEKVNLLMSKPLGEDFDKDTQAPFGTIPWLKDNSNGIELNDSLAIVQYLTNKYPGPLTPTSTENAALSAMYWSWAQDYYSFVLSPFHDIITGHNEPFWRNLRLTDTLAEGGKELGISNLTKLHHKRLQYLENHIKDKNLAPFVTGNSCSYADIFIYTCIRTVEHTGGFEILREACQGKPFINYPNILNCLLYTSPSPRDRQ